MNNSDEPENEGDKPEFYNKIWLGCKNKKKPSTEISIFVSWPKDKKYNKKQEDLSNHLSIDKVLIYRVSHLSYFPRANTGIQDFTQFLPIP